MVLNESKEYSVMWKWSRWSRTSQQQHCMCGLYPSLRPRYSIRVLHAADLQFFHLFSINYCTVETCAPIPLRPLAGKLSVHDSPSPNESINQSLEEVPDR